MTKTTKKGFTIIELLIVIVVIGILAAIVTVTYQGVQNRANTTSAAQNAREVAKKAEAYNASKNNFPLSAWDLINDTAAEFPAEAKLGESVKKLFDNVTDADTANAKKPEAANKTHIAYRPCAKTTDTNYDSPVGAIIYYWDYEKAQVADTTNGSEKPIRVGLTDTTTGVSCKAL